MMPPKFKGKGVLFFHSVPKVLHYPTKVCMLYFPLYGNKAHLTKWRHNPQRHQYDHTYPH